MCSADRESNHPHPATGARQSTEAVDSAAAQDLEGGRGSVRPDNAFAADFIHCLDDGDSPSHTYASLANGPWRIRPWPPAQGSPSSGVQWGCYAEGETNPVAILHDRHLALLIAAALPNVSRPVRFAAKPHSRNPVVLLDRGAPAGTLRWADDDLLAAINLLAGLLETPSTLARLLEAAGAPVLQRTGSILAARLEVVDETR